MPGAQRRLLQGPSGPVSTVRRNGTGLTSRKERKTRNRENRPYPVKPGLGLFLFVLSQKKGRIQSCFPFKPAGCVGTLLQRCGGAFVLDVSQTLKCGINLSGPTRRIPKLSQSRRSFSISSKGGQRGSRRSGSALPPPSGGAAGTAAQRFDPPPEYPSSSATAWLTVGWASEARVGLVAAS